MLRPHARENACDEDAIVFFLIGWAGGARFCLKRSVVKGRGKRGHIVAHDVFLGEQRGNICCGHKMFLKEIKNNCCVSDTNFVSATNVARADKQGNICVRNIVSSFATTLKQNQ